MSYVGPFAPEELEGGALTSLARRHSDALT
jgi:hypothetical protein